MTTSKNSRRGIQVGADEEEDRPELDQMAVEDLVEAQLRDAISKGSLPKIEYEIHVDRSVTEAFAWITKISSSYPIIRFGDSAFNVRNRIERLEEKISEAMYSSEFYDEENEESLVHTSCHVVPSSYEDQAEEYMSEVRERFADPNIDSEELISLMDTLNSLDKFEFITIDEYTTETLAENPSLILLMLENPKLESQLRRFLGNQMPTIGRKAKMPGQRYELMTLGDGSVAGRSGRTGSANYELWNRWKTLVNMSAAEHGHFMNSKEGKEAGMNLMEAREQGISTGRESARMLQKMIPLGETFANAQKHWTPTMWFWAGKQISFISRMNGNKGPLLDKQGRKTRKYTSLLLWGHDPLVGAKRQVKRSSMTRTKKDAFIHPTFPVIVDRKKSKPRVSGFFDRWRTPPTPTIHPEETEPYEIEQQKEDWKAECATLAKEIQEKVNGMPESNGQLFVAQVLCDSLSGWEQKSQAHRSKAVSDINSALDLAEHPEKFSDWMYSRHAPYADKLIIQAIKFTCVALFNSTSNEEAYLYMLAQIERANYFGNLSEWEVPEEARKLRVYYLDSARVSGFFDRWRTPTAPPGEIGESPKDLIIQELRAMPKDNAHFFLAQVMCEGLVGWESESYDEGNRAYSDAKKMLSLVGEWIPQTAPSVDYVAWTVIQNTMFALFGGVTGDDAYAYLQSKVKQAREVAQMSEWEVKEEARRLNIYYFGSQR